MHASLTFSFPWNTDAATAIQSVAAHFGATVSINGAAPQVPAHIKAAVENTASALGGVEQSPSIAFGALLNGAAGNGQATQDHAQSSVVAGTSTIAHAAQPATSATLPPASSAPVPPLANVAVAPVASVATVSPASNEVDSTGLPWDERIHSGNKTKSPSGEWRTKKGVDKALAATITAQLRAQTRQAAQPVDAVALMPSPQVIDPVAKRAAALDYAHAEAVRVCGAPMVDEATLQGLLSGKSATLTPQQNDWYFAYFAKRNAAFEEFMQAPNVAPGTGVANVSQALTINEAAAQAATVNDSAVSPTAAVGTLAPVQTAPVGVELDAAGLPHDVRINVGAKIKDAAGVWVQRHDVPGETKLLVMAELRAALAGNVAAQASNTQAGPASTPVAPTPPVVPVVSAADAGTDFAKLMQWIVANQQAGRITPTAGPDAAKSLGFAGADGNGSLVLMTQQVAYFPYIVQILQGQGAI